jgi:hypothetical protein
MKCPHCGYEKSLIHRAENGPDATLRWRECRSCGRPFTSREVVVENQGRGKGYVELPPVPKRAPSRAASERFRGVTAAMVKEQAPCLPDGMCEAIAEWWEVARWNRHRGAATWTRRALIANIARVAELCQRNEQAAAALVDEALERGWMAIKASYAASHERSGAAAPAAGFTPSSPAMQSAIQSWNARH